MPKYLLLITLLFVCISLSALGQSPANYKLVFEKAYLHTDRDIYTRGDTLWYKAYLVNAQNNTLTQSSGNLRVELIAPGAGIVNTQLIRLDKGLGNGDFNLADTLPSGHYRLRAYTNWMRNFGDNFIFEKEITLLNTAPIVAVTPSKGKKTTTTVPPTITNTPPLPQVSFYPEGSSLVVGIGSLVAIKADNGFGKGLPAHGTVLSAAGDTIAHFACDSLGMGLFTMLPVQGQTYHAVVSFGINNTSTNFQLQPALSDGLTIRVKQMDTLMQFIVGASVPPSTVKPIYQLIVRHGGVALVNHTFQPTDQQTLLKISTKGFPEGIVAITLYDADNKPNCERLVYIHHPHTSALMVTTGQKSYLPKETVTVNISAQPNTSLSMAVVDAGIVPVPDNDVVSYLMLTSELRGDIEHASRYFDTTNVNRAKQLDLLMMTQGWRDFVWRRLADTAIKITYAAENGVAVSGVVIDEIKEKPLSGLNITLFANASKGDKMFTTTTSSSGRFNVNNLVFYGKQEIKLSASNAQGKKFGTFELDTTSTLPVRVVKQPVYLSEQENLVADLVKKQEWELTKLNLHKVTALKEVKIKSTAVSVRYATHDNKYVRLDDGRVIITWGPLQNYNIKPKDYWTKTLSWYLIQAVPGAGPAGGITPGIKIGDPNNAVILVVNGSTFHVNYDLYYAMDIRKFKKIEIQPTPLGLRYIAYYVFLTTIDNPLEDNPGYINTTVEGYYQARTFYQPAPGAKLSLADYRSTIYWQPNITTDASGKARVSFPTSMAGKARIMIQGITPYGLPVMAGTTYNINRVN